MTEHTKAERGPEEPQEEVQEEAAERKFTNIDMGVAKEAAVKTFESIKEGSKKAWGVAVDSGKAVSGIVNENYGECEVKTAMLKRGWSYEVRLFHAGTNGSGSGRKPPAKGS